MIRNIKLLGCCFLLFRFQLLSAQLVLNPFQNLVLAENFETGSSNWTIISNNDNLFIIQGGEYLLNRKNTNTPYAVISGIRAPKGSFKIVTSVTLQKSADEKGSIGLLFALQEDRRGGYLLEINKSSQYRLRQLAGSDYIYLTGTEKYGGWVKSESIAEEGNPNLLEVRMADYNYDFYINGKFLKSMTNKVYATSTFGFVIGPGSKGSVDYVQFYNDDVTADGNGKSGDVDVASLAQSIIVLKSEINKLKEENEILKKTINAVKSESKAEDLDKQQLKDNLAEKEKEYNILMSKNDSLIKANTELKKYKEMVAGNENGDRVINLSRSLKAEKEKVISLQLTNKQLQQELDELKQKSKTGNPQNEQNKKADDFNLPK